MSAFVVAFAVKASVVLAGAALVNMSILRRSSAAWRHLVWTMAVTAVLLLPALSVVMPRWQIHVPVAAAQRTPSLSSAAMASGVTTRAESLQFAAQAIESRSTTPADAGAAPVDRATFWMNGAAIVYAMGVLVLGVRLVMQRRAVQRIARRAVVVSDEEPIALLRQCEREIGITRPVRLLRSLDRTMPMTFGTRQPTIVIPSVAGTWTADRWRAVLLHELAHIARRDCLTQWVAAVTCAIYWVHPGVWFAARRLRVERELACDDRVLQVGTVARDYAEHLLDLAYTLGGDRAPALVVSMARPGQLEGRMLAVLDAARNRAAPALRSRMTGLVIAAALVTPLAAAETMLVPDTTTFVAENGAKPAADDTQSSRRPPEQRDVHLPGAWEIRPSRDAREVHLQLHERINNSHGFSIAIDQFTGLSSAQLTGAGGAVQFSLRRDAGDLTFEGTIRQGVGAGTYNFTPSATFPSEMVKRGFARPAGDELYRLAVGNVGFGFLDELNAQKYARPDLAQLVRAADHGVSLDYLRDMGRAGHHLGQIEPLIKLRDHGVTPDYIREIASSGLKNLSTDELLLARDHGVDGDYVAEMKSYGYAPLPLDGLVNARDHGIDRDYVRGMRAAGFQLPLAELIRARDHGVDPDYVAGMGALGFKRLDMSALIIARDHGVDPDFAKGLRDLGYTLTLDELRNARDHGVDAEFVRRQNSRRSAKLSIDELIRIRDRGGNEFRD